MMSSVNERAIICVGDIDMDLIVAVPRLPARDEKVSGHRIALAPGGMAANVAVALARLGAPARIIGAIGEDAAGEDALTALRAEGVDVAHAVRRTGAATFMCVILVDASGEKSLVRVNSPAYLPCPSDLSKAAFDDACHVHMTFTEPELYQATVARARAVGVSLSLDLESADLPATADEFDQLLAPLNILFTSQKSRLEAERRFGRLSLHDGCTLITTRGADGAQLEGSGGVVDVPGIDTDVVDTSGAGDAFAAGFLYSSLHGADSPDALRFANALAALSVRAYGAQAGLPRASEVVTTLEAGIVHG